MNIEQVYEAYADDRTVITISKSNLVFYISSFIFVDNIKYAHFCGIWYSVTN